MSGKMRVRSFCPSTESNIFGRKTVQRNLKDAAESCMAGREKQELVKFDRLRITTKLAFFAHFLLFC